MTKCWECEAETDNIHHHHVVPKSRGGTKTVPLCISCHAKAHHRNKNMASGRLTSDIIKKRLESGGRWGRAFLGFKVENSKMVPTKLAYIIKEAASMSEAGISQKDIASYLATHAPDVVWSQPKISRVLKNWKDRGLDRFLDNTKDGQ